LGLLGFEATTRQPEMVDEIIPWTGRRIAIGGI
jgi:hypothetical protein